MQQNIHAEKILILDFGSQYTQLIARRVREIGVYCEILPWDAQASAIADFGARGIILSGGPESVSAVDGPAAADAVYELSVPILGICYGMQTMAQHFGGSVQASDHREFGYARVSVLEESHLLKTLADAASRGHSVLEVWMSHGDRVSELPPGFVVLGSTGAAPIAAMMDETRGCYGLQFHPEVTHTRQGREILRNFVLEICGCQALWTAGSIIDDSVRRIREQVGSDPVVLGLSGGVDSSVVAALLHRSIGSQLTCILVDTGLLRHAEGEQVMDTMARHMGVNVVRVDARERYFEALAGIADPEEKRKVIGRLFVAIFEEQARALGDVRWLAQGTIYPDVIESAGASTGKAHVIKSHHNVGGLPEEMNLGLVEPLRELFKDEVRRVGTELGLPREMVYRHPFPGPGLGVRILGEVRPDYVEILQQADHIFIEALREAELYDRVSQAFAVFLPVRSVGVTGDQRSYEYVIALRAVETVDFMTARWAHLPYDFLDQVSRRIVNRVRRVSRVVYDVSGKPPATIEWE